jgi:AcrR family transcriptional regulator
LETALEVIDREGPDAFSMRRVADELAVGVMTLYGYVRNKEEIVEGVTALAFAKLSTDTPEAARWDEQLRAEVTHLHDFTRCHPHLVSLILRQTSASPGLFRTRERMLGTLQTAGFDQETALRALGVLTSYALGFDQTRGGPGRIELPELPPEDFPYLAAAAERYPAHLSDEAFGYGLELLLRGLRVDLQGS